MNAFIDVTAWIVALIPFVTPPALVILLAVPRTRRRMLAPLRRRRAVRRERARVMAQARRDARTAILEAEADVPACMHGVPSPCGLCGSFDRPYSATPS